MFSILNNRYVPYNQMTKSQTKYLIEQTNGKLLSGSMPILFLNEYGDHCVSNNYTIVHIFFDALGPHNKFVISSIIREKHPAPARKIDCFIVLNENSKLLFMVVELRIGLTDINTIVMTRGDLETELSAKYGNTTAIFDMDDFEMFLPKQYCIMPPRINWAGLNPEIQEMFALLTETESQYARYIANNFQPETSQFDDAVEKYDNLKFSLPFDWKFYPIFRSFIQTPGISLFSLPVGDKFPTRTYQVVQYIGMHLNNLCDSIISEHIDISSVKGFSLTQLTNRQIMFTTYRKIRHLIYVQYKPIVCSFLELPPVETFLCDSVSAQAAWTEFTIQILVANVHRTKRLVELNGGTLQFGYIVA